MKQIILLIFLFAGISCISDYNNLQESFLSPAPEAKPWVYWYWMNGNVSREGITADIEAMSEVGIGGAFLMCIGGPWDRPGLDTAYNQLSPEWWRLVEHAFTEAERTGINLGMSACDGWATAGGPWIDPENAMKKVVWSKTNINGGGEIRRQIPLPPLHKGVYQQFGRELEGNEPFYKDIACYAFPAIEEGDQKMSGKVIRVTSDIEGLNASALFDGNVTKTAVNTGGGGYIQVEFEKAFTCRTVRLFYQPDSWLGYPYYGASMELLVGDNGTEFRSLGKFTPEQHGWQDDGCPVTIRIPETQARFFRFVFDTDTLMPVTMRYVGADRKYLTLSEIELSPIPRIGYFEGKAGYRYRIAPPLDPEITEKEYLLSDEVVNVTAYLDSTGMLRWNAPPGDWTILRMGYTLTGNENETGGGGIGLESDKLSKESTRLVFDGWLGEAVRKMEPELQDKVFSLMHVDSWESATQNWTDHFPEEFTQRRGYDPVPWLPALAGIPVGAAREYENFLYDFRLTIAELLNEHFYGELTRLAHESGLEFSAEATAPVMVSDGMLHHKYIDRPMGEFWRDDPAPMDKPEDILEAVSGAHLYNKPVVQAEAFTDVNSKWYEHPFALKKQGDFNFTRGINKFFMHVYVQQPFVEKKPGFTLGQIGLNFNRGQTWWKQARPWMQYLITCQSMLQQGTQVADILCFTGMEIPRRALLPDQLNQVIPDGYRYLSVNPDALLNQITVRDGKMILPNGAVHRILLLPDAPFLGNGLYTPSVMEKLESLVRSGIILVGPKPRGTIGLKNYETNQQRVLELADRMWGAIDGRQVTSNHYGKGVVYQGVPLEEVLEREGLRPDVVFEGTDSMEFIHKIAGNTDFYFVCNQSDHPVNTTGIFRISDRVPEIWDPVTQEMYLAKYETLDEQIKVELDLPPNGSLFVVFTPTPTENIGYKPEWSVHEEIALDEPWEIRFEKGRGLPEDYSLRSDTLFSLTNHQHPDVKHFSGTVTYKGHFDLIQETEHNHLKYELDLGQVANIAEVFLNGKEMGTLWTKPYRTAVSDALVNGKNELVIEVTNTWNNRIVRDMQLPYEERVSYFPHYEEFSEAGDVNHFLTHCIDTALRDAGLMGPCQLIVFETISPLTRNDQNKSGSSEPQPGDADYPLPSPCKRHDIKVNALQNGHYDLLLIGNSIIQNLNESDSEWDPLKPVWNKYFAPRNAINLGFSGYRTEQILWNLQNGQLDMERSPEVAILLIGTNNLDDQHYPEVHTAEQVFNGIKAITREIRHRHSTTRILILSPFIAGGPDDKSLYHRKYNRSRKCRDELLKVGKLVKKLADDEKVYSLDLNHVFLNADGSINPYLMPDLIHPNGPGTLAWVKAMEPTLSKMMEDHPIR